MRFTSLGLFLVALVPAAGLAYVPSTTFNTLTRLRWMASNCVMVRVSSKGSDDLPAASAVAAAKRALNNWQAVTAGCSYLKFQVLPDSDVKAVFNKDGENENAIVWVEKGWTEKGGSHDAAAAALTTVFFIEKADSQGDGQILDADIELNGVFFHFSDSGAADKTDLENTITHELGHLLGLDHICDDSAKDGKTPKDNLGNAVPSCFPVQNLAAWMREVTMYNFADPGETKKRSPEADDIKGICETYPKAKDPGQCATAVYVGNGGGCSLDARTPAGMGAALLLSLAGALLLARRRRDVTPE